MVWSVSSRESLERSDLTLAKRQHVSPDVLRLSAVDILYQDGRRVRATRSQTFLPTWIWLNLPCAIFRGVYLKSNGNAREKNEKSGRTALGDSTALTYQICLRGTEARFSSTSNRNRRTMPKHNRNRSHRFGRPHCESDQKHCESCNGYGH